MEHNKRRTSSIDSYFSVQKKSKYQDIESNDTNIDQTSVISTPPSISSISTSDQDIEVVNADAVWNSVENKSICDDISKRSTRNTMNDSRLSDMCLLAVERDFEIDFEKVIDVFSLNHGNSRILLR